MPVIPAFGGLGGELGVPGHPPSAAQGVCARVLTQKSKNKKKIQNMIGFISIFNI